MLEIGDSDDGFKVRGGTLVKFAQLGLGVKAERFAQLLGFCQTKNGAVSFCNFVKLSNKLAPKPSGVWDRTFVPTKQAPLGRCRLWRLCWLCRALVLQKAKGAAGWFQRAFPSALLFCWHTVQGCPKEVSSAPNVNKRTFIVTRV